MRGIALDMIAAPASQPSPATQPGIKGKRSGKVLMFDDVDQASRVIFVMDASGSMINKFAALKDELGKSLTAMHVEQSFGLVFLQDTGCATLSSKLLAVNPANL